MGAIIGYWQIMHIYAKSKLSATVTCKCGLNRIRLIRSILQSRLAADCDAQIKSAKHLLSHYTSIIVAFYVYVVAK